MEENQPQPTLATSPIYERLDENRYNRIVADLTGYCKLLNRYLAKAKEQRLLFVSVNDELIKSLIHGSTDVLLRGLQRKFEEETRDTPVITAHALTAPKLKMEEAIKRLVADMGAEAYTKQLPLGLGNPLEMYEPRMAYIHGQNDEATFNPDEVRAACTEKIEPSEAARAYVERAEQLFAALREFDRMTCRLTRNFVRGINDANHGMGMIEICDGKVFLDYRRLRFLNFDNAEALINHPDPQMVDPTKDSYVTMK